MIIFAFHRFIIYIVCRPVVEIANNSPITIFTYFPLVREFAVYNFLPALKFLLLYYLSDLRVISGCTRF